MKIIKINLNNIKREVINQITDVLMNGGIVVHPTDTCYGIAADIYNIDAIKKVYEFKKRPQDKHLSIIVSSKKMFKDYGSWNPVIEKKLREHKNKMFSFVVDKTNKIPLDFNRGAKDIAIQMPKSNFSIEMIKAFKSPLTATSANISNLPSVYSIEELLKQIEDETVLPDLIIDAGKRPTIKPSTIIRIKNEGFEILRD